MSRYIDADHAEFRLQCCGTYHGVIAFDTVKAVLNKAPSIDIVFCKECRYFIDNLTEDDTDEAYDACRWDWKRQMPRPDDFCSYGQKGDENVETD